MQSVQEIYTHIYVFLPNFFHNKKILNIYSYCKVSWLGQRSRGDDNLTEGHEHRRLVATNHSCSGPPGTPYRGRKSPSLVHPAPVFCLSSLSSCLDVMQGHFLWPWNLKRFLPTTFFAAVFGSYSQHHTKVAMAIRSPNYGNWDW